MPRSKVYDPDVKPLAIQYLLEPNTLIVVVVLEFNGLELVKPEQVYFPDLLAALENRIFRENCLAFFHELPAKQCLGLVVRIGFRGACADSVAATRPRHCLAGS